MRPASLRDVQHSLRHVAPFDASFFPLYAVIGYVEDSTTLFPEDSRNIGSVIPQQSKAAMEGTTPVPPSPTRHNFKSKRRHKHDKQSSQSRDSNLSTPQRTVSPQLPPEPISNDMSVRSPPVSLPWLLLDRHKMRALRTMYIACAPRFETQSELLQLARDSLHRPAKSPRAQ